MHTLEFQRDSLSQAVNQNFAEVRPGFFEVHSTPVLWTPIIIPAAVMLTQASVLCAAC